MLRDDDMVWVHDYHLIPFGEQLRQMDFRQRMGFFLHTPWPAPEILLALPSHETLVRAHCSYDVLGFQTERDRQAFITYLTHEAEGEVVDDHHLRAFGRIVLVEAFPTSVETRDLEADAAQPPGSRPRQR